ncbi:MAG: hypothetical protein ACR2QO_21780, partial [Acidimicrobiales bacterium]
MKLLLRVEHPTATGERVVDVEIDVALSHTCAELATALAIACRVPDLGDQPLLHNPTMRLVLADTPLAESGLVSGDTITLGAGSVPAAPFRTGVGTATSGAGAYSARPGAGPAPTPKPCTLSSPVNATAASFAAPEDGRSSDALHLVVTSGLDAGSAYPLVAGTHTVGRSRLCELTLLDPQISRRDFRIRIGSAVASPTSVDASPPPPSTAVSDPQPPPPSARSVETARRGVRVPAITVEPGIDRSNELRVNGEAIVEPTPLLPGDDVQVGCTTLQLRTAIADRRRPLRTAGTIPFERTPQFRQPIQVRKVGALGRVPVTPTPRRFQVLAVIAPLLMGFSMAFLFNSPRFLLFAVLSPVVAIGNNIDSRRNGAKDFVRKTAELRERLAARRHELRAHVAAERALRHRGSPDVVELANKAATYDKRLWNRARRSPDFLELRAGLGTVAAQIDVKEESQGDDDL